MKRKTKVLIGASAITIAAGLAFATPTINLTGPVVAAGNSAAWINVHGVAKMANGNYFNVNLTTEGPSTISSQVASYKAGGETGWHKHPGLVTLTLTQGTIQWFDGNCNMTTYKAGDSWAEGSQLHMFRVVGSETTLAYATFITAEGEALRTDEPAPACAAALGLN
jgi:quercetin dioxygenase-like cupin family protein